ncbi:hypothetical protein WR25_19930 [Diploscapter pachys]|uniref:Uncharacterized protein n=1 Tax=Diploscapter pachys TaxID=2018661 RepID=A0A2A2M5D2_9BILA|nr:hypothetical protein WR25_19930 [Diploscapter pachys]
MAAPACQSACFRQDRGALEARRGQRRGGGGGDHRIGDERGRGEAPCCEEQERRHQGGKRDEIAVMDGQSGEARDPRLAERRRPHPRGEPADQREAEDDDDEGEAAHAAARVELGTPATRTPSPRSCPPPRRKVDPGPSSG